MPTPSGLWQTPAGLGHSAAVWPWSTSCRPPSSGPAGCWTRPALAWPVACPQGPAGWPGLHDPDARPIRKGRIGRPVEFGYKAQVADNTQGVVVDHAVMLGNPPDAPLLVPAIERVIQQTGRVPGAVTADRGYGEAAVEREVAELGVARIAIPRKGRAGPARQAVERGRGFRRLVKWRTGCEGRISQLKHRFGWARTLLDGLQGAQIWCGLGVLAHNLVKAAGLLAAKQHKPARRR